MNEYLIKKVHFWQKNNIIFFLSEILQKENVIITSTDTILGLLAPVTKNGFEKLNKLKGSRNKKPYLILTSVNYQNSSYFNYSTLPTSIKTLLKQCWPGPLTVIFKARQDVLPFDHETVALRCPSHQGLLALLQSFDGLLSTSANKSNHRPPHTLQDIDNELLQAVDLVVLDKINSVRNIKPSTIIDVSSIDNGHVRIVRKGAYPVHMLERFLGETLEK